MELVGKPEMIWVAVADDDPEQRGIAVIHAGNSGQWQRLVERGIKRAPNIEDDALARLEL